MIHDVLINHNDWQKESIYYTEWQTDGTHKNQPPLKSFVYQMKSVYTHHDGRPSQRLTFRLDLGGDPLTLVVGAICYRRAACGGPPRAGCRPAPAVPPFYVESHKKKVKQDKMSQLQAIGWVLNTVHPFSRPPITHQVAPLYPRKKALCGHSMITQGVLLVTGS